MLHLLLTPANTYRFYDTDTHALSKFGYSTIYDAYSVFPKLSHQTKPLSLAFRILASSPDYASFPQLYPELLI